VFARQTERHGGRSLQNCDVGHFGSLFPRSALGFDHKRLTYRYQGRDFRLNDVHGEVVKEVLA
jgi:hypothetical protein